MRWIRADTAKRLMKSAFAVREGRYSYMLASIGQLDLEHP